MLQTEEHKFIKETLLLVKSHTGTHTDTLIAEDFSVSLSPIDRSSRQKINRDILVLTDVIDQMNLTDIYRTLHPNEKKKPSFSLFMELCPKLTIHWKTKQVSTDKRKLEEVPTSYQAMID